LIPGSSPRTSPVEEALDAVAHGVDRLVDGPLDLPVRLGRDHRVDATPFEIGADGVAVIALVARCRAARGLAISRACTASNNASETIALCWLG